MTQKAAKKRELRVAIDRLPLATRRAMLEGIETTSIVVGGDGDPHGGVCPIYATPSPPPKQIGRPFARAWDRYAGARLPRKASERELSTLRSMLATSIERETETPVSLRAAITAHRVSLARTGAASRERVPSPSLDAEITRPAPRWDSGERDRTAELSRREGWAWSRPFRSYDDYERALRELQDMAQEIGPVSEPGPLLERV